MHLIEDVYAPADFDGSEGLLATIVSSQFDDPGLTFFTKPNLSQQVAHLRHPGGHKIAPHRHCEAARTVWRTTEVIIVRRGRLRVDLYTSAGAYVLSRELGPGDIVILAGGGHGFECLEEVEAIEVKAGPYLGERADKVRFAGACR